MRGGQGGPALPHQHPDLARGHPLEARARVLGSFEEDTLVEAVAHDLERQHGFVHIDDARLSAAVNVSEQEGETFLAEVSDEAEDQAEDGAGYRSLLVDLDPNELN